MTSSRTVAVIYEIVGLPILYLLFSSLSIGLTLPALSVDGAGSRALLAYVAIYCITRGAVVVSISGIAISTSTKNASWKKRLLVYLSIATIVSLASMTDLVFRRLAGITIPGLLFSLFLFVVFAYLVQSVFSVLFHRRENADFDAKGKKGQA